MTADLSRRQREILDRARQTGRVLVDELALHFAVSPRTVCRDLAELCAARILTRTHGGAAVGMIGQFRVDTAVIGTSAVDADGTLLDFDVQGVLASRALIGNARRVILVADSGKLARAAPVAAICQEHGVEVVGTEAGLPDRAAD